MNTFSQFSIQAPSKGFEGDKIKMSRILNREIVVHDFKIEDSKVFKEKGSGKCLQLQIFFSNEKHIIFTGASGLIEVIQQIPQNGFPFTTTIIQENDRYIFT
ncbi:MAG: hypothetical protein WCI31_06215 [Prolixibacteraceae bacterium]